jgi:DNA-binding LacI/PurR family transcriptional regulator
MSGRTVLRSARTLLSLDPVTIQNTLEKIHSLSSDLLQNIEQQQHNNRLQLQMQQLCEQALQHHDATAWVAANDECALYCQAFCRRRAITLPTQLSLVSFNDSLESFYTGLSSYNFNAEAVMRSLVDFIISPPARRRLRRQIIDTCIEGFVTVRETTGPPPV